MNSDDLGPPGQLAPVVEDLSIYLICGRVTTRHERGFTHVSTALTDAQAAERLGFRRGWLSERFDLKDAGAILGGIAARTTRFGVGTGVWSASSRHPMVAASFGATMNALYGPRFVLGLGRGVPLPDMPEFSFGQFVHYAETVKALWCGGVVDYNGTQLRTVDALAEVPKPEIWACGYGRPKFAKAAAHEVFDAVMLYPFLTVEAVRTVVERLRNACADRGRDPESLRICHPIVVAPELDDFTTRAYAHARAVTYLEWPGHGESLCDSNKWDTSVLTQLREHKQLQGKNADQDFHRAELLEPARLVPDEWMEESCAIGTAAHCVDRLAEYRAAGVDEIAIYASTPAENAELIARWRERAAKRQVAAV
ncbi:TIGR03857 family LLM class F420-dependent oxidoreductase [Mycobacterium sp. pUA109]|uniref:TIGR03857 family LLM class F420-dependent oxidoreductase n=1 Tax=Mycobacterium sp. pUA109 TaxID=3238982 RepID=UPI00351B6C35